MIPVSPCEALEAIRFALVTHEQPFFRARFWRGKGCSRLYVDRIFPARKAEPKGFLCFWRGRLCVGHLGTTETHESDPSNSLLERIATEAIDGLRVGTKDGRT